MPSLAAMEGSCCVHAHAARRCTMHPVVRCAAGRCRVASSKVLSRDIRDALRAGLCSYSPAFPRGAAARECVRVALPMQRASQRASLVLATAYAVVLRVGVVSVPSLSTDPFPSCVLVPRGGAEQGVRRRRCCCQGPLAAVRAAHRTRECVAFRVSGLPASLMQS